LGLVEDMVSDSDVEAIAIRNAKDLKFSQMSIHFQEDGRAQLSMDDDSGKGTEHA
jgi:hypothetical protein